MNEPRGCHDAEEYYRMEYGKEWKYHILRNTNNTCR